MKMLKKKILILALIVGLLAIASIGTLAWFQATASVTNVFQVSTDGPSHNAAFKLALFESEIDPDTGRIGDANGNNIVDEVSSNTYINITPGDELDKNPTVRNEGTYSQWVRVKVVFSNFSQWDSALGSTYDYPAMFNTASDWFCDGMTVDTVSDTMTLTYYKTAALEPGDESTLFTRVKIPFEFTVENMPQSLNINLVGQAIQSKNTANNAKESFETYWSE